MDENLRQNLLSKILLLASFYVLVLYFYISTNFPLNILSQSDTFLIKFLINCLYFAAILFISQLIITQKLSKNLIKLLLLFTFILAFNRVIGTITKTLITDLNYSYDEKVAVFTVSTLFLKTLFMMSPILFFWKRISEISFRDLFHIKQRHIKYYIMMFLALLPILYFASTIESFHQIYPRYNLYVFEADLGVFVTYSLFYLIYLTNFIAVELYFRGALMLYRGSSTIYERVVPMIILYSMYHIGKPIEELISALFGGLILGIIAFRTKSIMGGIYLHISIAFFLDIFVMINS